MVVCHSAASYNMARVVRHQPSSGSLIVPRTLDSIAEFQTSRQSPSVDSPPGYGDSPHSASFPSHSELDDYIIDEILSLEDEQLAARQQSGLSQLPASYSCTDGLTALTSSQNHGGGRAITGSSSTTSSDYNRQVSSSAPTGSLDIDSLVHQEVVVSEHEFFRDRRKKDIHNMIERRRRYNINDRIKELGMMLPKHTASEDMKLNKGTILKASCDYIRQLQRDREHMVRVQQQQGRLESAARLYAQRVKELEAQLQKNGLPIPPPVTLPPVGSPSVTTVMGRPIKQEPIDTSSPASTPGAQASPGFLSALSDTTAAMAIASPSGIPNSSSRGGGAGSFFSVGSQSETPAFATPQGGHELLETPQVDLNAPIWPSQQQQQQQQQPGAPHMGPPGNHPFPDLMMDISAMTTGPLLQGDPMISA
uniref:BHLH domain-containing protein n=1 Tax=Plectus sambesii TaxID=2011161 RepID=A0A914W5M0_9BILA